jgi:hypothetical protein
MYAFHSNRITQGNFKIDNTLGSVSVGESVLDHNGPDGNITITPTYLR